MHAEVHCFHKTPQLPYYFPQYTLLYFSTVPSNAPARTALPLKSLFLSTPHFTLLHPDSDHSEIIQQHGTHYTDRGITIFN